MRLTLDGSFVLILGLAFYALLSPSQMTSSSSSGGWASMDLVSSSDESFGGGGVVGIASAGVGVVLVCCPDVDGRSSNMTRRMGQSAV